MQQPLQRRVTQYSVIRAVGKGTFGIVYEAEECGTGRIVAVKKVFQDKNYKVFSVFSSNLVESRVTNDEVAQSPQRCDALQFLLLANGSCAACQCW